MRTSQTPTSSTYRKSRKSGCHLHATPGEFSITQDFLNFHKANKWYLITNYHHNIRIKRSNLSIFCHIIISVIEGFFSSCQIYPTFIITISLILYLYLLTSSPTCTSYSCTKTSTAWLMLAAYSSQNYSASHQESCSECHYLLNATFFLYPPFAT